MKYNLGSFHVTIHYTLQHINGTLRHYKSLIIHLCMGDYWDPNFFSNGEILKMLEMKISEFANSIDPDEVAHYEPPHLDLHCLLVLLWLLNMTYPQNFADINFVCFFGV